MDSDRYETWYHTHTTHTHIHSRRTEYAIRLPCDFLQGGTRKPVRPSSIVASQLPNQSNKSINQCRSRSTADPNIHGMRRCKASGSQSSGNGQSCVWAGGYIGPQRHAGFAPRGGHLDREPLLCALCAARAAEGVGGVGTVESTVFSHVRVDGWRKGRDACLARRWV